MFDIGFWELLLIGVVTLVVVGPERLPEVAKSAGVYVAKFRRFVAGVKSDIDAELDSGELKKILGDQRDQIRELKDIVDTTRKEIETTTTSAVASASEMSSSLESKYNDMGTSVSVDSSTATNADSAEPGSTETDVTKSAGDKPASSA